MSIAKNLKYLNDIGTKLSDFEEVPHKDKSYFVLKKDNFGYIEKMKSKKNGKFYAVKKIDRKSKYFKIKNFKRETGIMFDLYHPNLIRLYGFFEDKEKIEKFKEVYKDTKNVYIGTEDKEVCCLVLEFADNDSLEEYYKKYKSNRENFKNGKVIEESYLQNKSEDEIKQFINDNYIPLDQKIVIKFFKQLLEATKYLHYKSIIHRDIRPDNILLDENNNIKITNFGISAIVRDGNVANLNKDNDLFSNFTRVGGLDFACPEMFTNEQYDYQADIFSLGLTMLCLMSYRYPIIIIKGPTGKSRNFKREYMLKYYNEYLRNLVLRMIDEDNNNNRPSAKEALDELLKIEKYIENPGGNISIKIELDRKNEFANIKRSKAQNLINIPQLNQNNFQINQNYQGYQNNFYQQNNIKNPINQNYQYLQRNINPNQNNIYSNFNNQMYTQNTYQMYPSNQTYYQYNQGYIYSTNSNIPNQNVMNISQNMNQNMINMSQNMNQNMMNMSQNMNQNMMNMSQNMNQNMMNMNQNMVNMSQNMNQNMSNMNQNINQNMNQNMSNMNQNMVNMSQNMNQNMSNMGQNINQNMMNMNQNMVNMNQYMVNMDQNISQNMMNMSPISSTNMINSNINNLASDIKPKITSLIRVLQCLYGCLEDIGPIDNLKNCIKFWYQSKNIQNSLTLDILNILSQSVNPDNNFINSIYNLRNKINEQTNLFSTNEELAPNLIFFNIFRIINDEYKINEIPYNNFIFDDTDIIEKIPIDYLLLLLKKIKSFEQKISPCYSNFYYLLFDVIKCSNCNLIVEVNDKNFLFSNFLGLPGGVDGNISDLIKFYILKEPNPQQKYKCKCSFYECQGKTEKAFINTPNYFLIDFEGENKIKKHLDEKLDLTKYKLTNKGPNQYDLYTFIIKYEEQYMAYVKEGSSWTVYSNETTKTTIPFVNLDCIPYYAIYKGLK